MNDWVDSPLRFSWAVFVAPAGMRAPWWSIARVWVSLLVNREKKKRALRGRRELGGGGGRYHFSCRFYSVADHIMNTFFSCFVVSLCE